MAIFGRTRIAEQIGQLPTREEMKGDLAAMEHRIENMLRCPGTRH